jgi:hypothetical protein
MTTCSLCKEENQYKRVHYKWTPLYVTVCKHAMSCLEYSWVVWIYALYKYQINYCNLKKIFVVSTLASGSNCPGPSLSLGSVFAQWSSICLSASDLKGRGFDPQSEQKLYGLIFASMRHMKVADNPTLSDMSINRGLVCVARIPSCTDSKDPDARVLDGWVPATKTHVGLASTHSPCKGNSTKRHRAPPAAWSDLAVVRKPLQGMARRLEHTVVWICALY